MKIMLRFLYNALWTRNVQIVFQHGILAQCFRQFCFPMVRNLKWNSLCLFHYTYLILDLIILNFKKILAPCSNVHVPVLGINYFISYFLNNTFQFIIKALSQSCISTFQNDENINKTYIGLYESFFIITT